ncbi:unnamed protein product [Hymenolepis diminuta]|uniref:Poly(A) RNA polymerase mitochondrial-like central palm domain-containing protein n=1 Tax=Hymenolepis diminuta TaxID=6216 RepID=A0A564YQ41_HYMDI|nr:unnamed protein product [Hymenolepis diminuta]
MNSSKTCEFCEEPEHIERPCPLQLVKNWRKLQVTVPKLSNYLYLIELSNAFERLVESNTPDPQLSERHQSFINRLEEFFQTQFPGSKLETYGSCINGFSTGANCLDLSLTFSTEIKETSLDASHERGTGMIESVSKLLTNNETVLEIQDIKLIYEKIPVIIFVSNKDGLYVNLSLSDPLRSASTRLVKEYNYYAPQLRTLNIVFLTIIKNCLNLHSRERGFSSFTSSLMLIYYLQQKGYLPCLQEAYEGDTKPEIIGNNCNVWFQTDRDVVAKIWRPPNDNITLAELWINFLKFYLFEFDRNKYHVNISSLKPTEHTEPIKYLSIIDPFLKSRNLTATIKPKVFKMLFKLLYDTLIYHSTDRGMSPNYVTWTESLFFPAAYEKHLDPILYILLDEKNPSLRGYFNFYTSRLDY